MFNKLKTVFMENLIVDMCIYVSNVTYGQHFTSFFFLLLKTVGYESEVRTRKWLELPSGMKVFW
jgi:hypothetical protein